MAAKTEKGVMTKALRKTEALLREMVAITLRTDLTRNQRTNLETCITIHMHQKVGLYCLLLVSVQATPLYCLQEVIERECRQPIV